MSNYTGIQVPEGGARITIKSGEKPVVPDNPIVGFIEGDGIGADIWAATSKVLNSAVDKCYGGKRKIHWAEIYAGEKAAQVYDGNWFPDETLEAIRDFKVAIKGPLTTPVGGNMRSLNVGLRQKLDLYSCVRPCRWFQGVPAPVVQPEKVNMTIFRENTEDVYAGIEWPANSTEANALIALSLIHI